MQDLETAAALDGQFEGAIEQAGIEQVALETKPAALDAGGKTRAGRLRLGQTQGEALGRAAGFHEFAQGGLENGEARRDETRSQVSAHLIEENALADIH